MRAPSPSRSVSASVYRCPVSSAWRRTTFLKLASLVMDKPPLDTLVPQRRGVGRWPVTLTTERANPLRRRNPDWGGCSTARRPVAAVSKLFLTRSVVVKRARKVALGRPRRACLVSRYWPAPGRLPRGSCRPRRRAGPRGCYGRSGHGGVTVQLIGEDGARAPPAPASARRTTLRPGSTSASRTRFPGHVFQEPRVGEVAEEHNMTFPDPKDLDGRCRDRPARRGHGRLRPHLRDYHLRVLGLVKPGALGGLRT